MKSNKELAEKYIHMLKQCHSVDVEMNHSKADDIICQLLIELGYQEVVNSYDNIDKWYA